MYQIYLSVDTLTGIGTSLELKSNSILFDDQVGNNLMFITSMPGPCTIKKKFSDDPPNLQCHYYKTFLGGFPPKLADDSPNLADDPPNLAANGS